MSRDDSCDYDDDGNLIYDHREDGLYAGSTLAKYKAYDAKIGALSEKEIADGLEDNAIAMLLLSSEKVPLTSKQFEDALHSSNEEIKISLLERPGLKLTDEQWLGVILDKQFQVKRKGLGLFRYNHFAPSKKTLSRLLSEETNQVSIHLKKSGHFNSKIMENEFKLDDWRVIIGIILDKDEIKILQKQYNYILKVADAGIVSHLLMRESFVPTSLQFQKMVEITKVHSSNFSLSLTEKLESKKGEWESVWQSKALKKSFLTMKEVKRKVL